MRGHAIIHDPTSPASMKRRQFLIDSLRKSGIEWSEEIDGSRMIIRYQGQPKRATRASVADRLAPPPPIRLEKCLRSRYESEPDDVEYWDEMVRLAAEREGATVATIAIRDGWKTGQWRDTWAVMVSEHLAINRRDHYWAITHIPTGLAAGSSQRLRDAVAKAREVSHWPEWAALRCEADITPEFRQKATQALQEVAA